jgi:hypothetical protein
MVKAPVFGSVYCPIKLPLPTGDCAFESHRGRDNFFDSGH